MNLSVKANYPFFIIFIFLQGFAIAQAPDTMWSKTYGGSLSDAAKSVQQTTDGGYIITGTTESFGSGNYDAWLIKTDSNGDTLWTKTYGGNEYDWTSSVQQTIDGGYILVGQTSSFSIGYDVWLIKTDVFGDTLWTKTFGGSQFDACYSVQQTLDGGFIMVGETHSFSVGAGDVWLIKTDSFGEISWTKTYGGNYWDSGASVEQTADSGYIIAGDKDGLGGVNGNDIWLIKTDELGDTLWTKSFGGMYDDYGSSVTQTADGGYIITGMKDAFGGINNSDVWLIKTDSNGDTLWTKTYGTSYYDWGRSVQQTSDGGYIVAGLRDSYTGVSPFNAWLIKTNSSGDTMWTKTYGTQLDDGFQSVQKTADGGYIIAGWTESYGAGNEDVWLIKLEPDPSVPNISVTSPNGSEVWVMNETEEIVWSSENVDSVKIELSIDNGSNWTTIVDSFPSSGSYSWFVNSSASSDECLMRITDISNNAVYDESDSVFTIENASGIDEKEVVSEYILMQNYPNPFNNSTVISYSLSRTSFVTIKIFDALGNEIATLVNDVKPSGSFKVIWNADNLPSGIYYYQLIADNSISTKKMILLK